MLTWLRTIINQENKVVQEGITITLVEGRANLRTGGEAVSAEQQPTNGVAN